MGFDIDQLIGESWNTAILNVMHILNKGRDNKLFYQRDKFFVEDIAKELGVTFTADGEIMR